MLCLECGAEMRLVQVVEDTTMFVSGYEHHTWQCSACPTVERRMTFTREKTPPPIAPTAPNPTTTQTLPAEPTPTVQPTQTATVEPTETLPVAPTQAGPLDPAHPNPPIALQMNARLQKLRSLQERATAAKETASERERREEFNRFWESLR
jgi:hypothetical protein